MNDLPYQPMSSDPIESPNSESNERRESGAEDAPELFGAMDIVEAFTALRQELKMQVRNGRDLQQALSDGLGRIEQRVAAQPTHEDSVAASEEPRQLAEAVAEMEESLQRALEALPPRPTPSQKTNLIDGFDAAVRRASWGARTFAGKLLLELRELVEQAADEATEREAMLDSTRRGLELLLQRTLRLMQQCDIQRVDVLHQPFDAEAMHAVDVVDDPSVPSSHIAEQIRPAYRWRGRILRYADVRIAR